MHNSQQLKESVPLRLRLAPRMAGGTLLALLLACSAAAQTSTVTHADLQAVDLVGFSVDATQYPFVIQGVLLNDPEEMLDAAYRPEATFPWDGGQYQTFIQAVDTDDRGGTALYMSQMSIIGDDYDEATWSNEMQRVHYGAGSRPFRKGDLVEITARKTLFFGGKRNINEAHRTSVSNDFDITLVKANAGLPQAEVLTLSDLVETNGTEIFDATRALSGEHWQSMRVRLDGIRLATTNGWGQLNWADRICTATDDTGRSLPLRMPLTDLGDAPSTSTWFSAVGIMNQESGSSLFGTNGYELFVQEIGPVLSVGTNITGALAVSFSADYEGFVLEASDDGLSNWSDVDITPVKVIVVEDDSDSPNRAYRLRKID